MSTNCRSLDDMNESEARDYCQHLIERIKDRQKQQEAYLARRASRGSETPTDTLYRDYIMLDEAIVEVLRRLIS